MNNTCEMKIYWYCVVHDDIICQIKYFGLPENEHCCNCSHQSCNCIYLYIGQQKFSIDGIMKSDTTIGFNFEKIGVKLRREMLEMALEI